ncbi:DUF1501 domain-containing protein [Verrucomicrobia bacterium]|jgi:hypothetical protein|nr:DUF1501 domain-containing protein [Verrucomicrobiota bacterium]MDB4798435.1 DUF1501 domain-containing protein [Verrucomicrobiota bacterium]
MKRTYPRREFLRVGALGGLLSLSSYERFCRLNAEPQHSQRSAILVFLKGGPSHLDTFDLKPEAPSEYRGEFSPISTNVPGVQISEHLPKLAKRMDQLALIRGISHNLADHGLGTRYLATGNRPQPIIHYPEYGSVVSRQFPVRQDLPAFVSIHRSLEGPGYLGPEFGGLDTGEKPRANQSFNVRGVTLGNGLSLSQLDRREALVSDLDRYFGEFERQDPELAALDEFSQKAYRILSSARTREAFDLSKESPSIVDRFGPDETNQSLLLATRLVEAGVRFVTVIADGWDTHQNNFSELKRRLLPSLDQGLAAFMETMLDKGLLESTAVMVTGEFGRTPKINATAGRDHWPRAMFALMAGGAANVGQVLGASDDKGVGPADGGYSPDDLAASFYQNIGIDPRMEFHARNGRPITLVRNGQVIPGLLG